MPQISKFLFETDFAEPEATHPEPQPVDDDGGVETPVFSEAELLSAREHGYEAGIAAGQAQALAGVEKQAGEVIAEISSKLDAIGEQVAAQKVLVEKDVAVLANAIATKIGGAAPDEARVALLERLVNECVSKLYQAPEVVVRVPADLEDALKSQLAMSNNAVSVSVIPDQALTGTDCQLTWLGGGAERNEDDIRQQVDDLLDHYLTAQSGAPTDLEGRVDSETDGDDAATETLNPSGAADEPVSSPDTERPLDTDDPERADLGATGAPLSTEQETTPHADDAVEASSGDQDV